MTAQTTYFSIALPVPLRTSFDYKSESESPIQPGCRVEVPFGSRRLIGIVVKQHTNTPEQKDRVKGLFKVLDESPCIPQELLQLCLWGAEYYHHPIGEVLFSCLPKKFRVGDSLEAELAYRLTTEGKGLPDSALSRAKKQQSCFNYLLKQGPALDSQLKERGFSAAILKPLLEKGLVEKTHLSTLPSQKKQPDRLLRETAAKLNEEQSGAAEKIRYHEFNCYLLEGITGCGKTEIYMQVTERVLRSGKQALILIPEIGLSSQTVDRFRKRFDAEIVELHSNVSELKRAKNWEDAKLGKAQIIIGTRLAALTPFAELGVIVIDEEHDLSYKQQDGFKYSARDVSIVRAHKNNIPIILGTATPSLESLNNAISGRYAHLRITKRAGDSIPPKLLLEDLRKKPLHAGLSKETLDQIYAHLNNQKQVLIFLNRRGYAPNLLCHQCGWSATCRHCDAKMTVHTSPPHIHCHHCGSQGPITRHCPSCASTELGTQGLGTEQTEEVLLKLFPNVNTIRIDRDSTQSKSAFETILSEISKGKPCILVGTQMLSKGHHLPAVSLVVIVDADQGLLSPDFRGTERLGQQIIQVAGRSGRSSTQGTVIIQSHAPDHPTLELLLKKGYHQFAKKILEDRRISQTPPYWSLSVFKAESKRPENAIEFLEIVVQVLSKVHSHQFQIMKVLGPFPSSPERIKDRFRYQVNLTTKGKSDMKNILGRALKEIDQHALSKRTRWSIDVDAN